MTTRMNGIDRRSMMKISVGGAAALLVARPSFAQSTTIKAAWYGGQDTHERMQKALAIFTQKNPDIAVEVEFAPFADFWDRMPVQYSGGAAPDMHRHSMTYLYEYEQRNLLADLTPFVGSVIDTSQLYPGVVEIGTRDDKLNAIGNNQIALALFYDKAKLDAAGVTGRLEGMTWDGYREISAELAKAGGDGKFGTNDAGGFLAMFELWLNQNGKQLYPEAGGVGFDATDAAGWFAFWQQMRDEKAAPPPAITSESVGFQNAPMVRDLAAMQTGWCQQIVFFQQLMQSELAVHACPVPEGAENNGHFIRALDFWVVPRQSKNVEQAAKLIDFLLNDEDAISTLAITLGGPPSEKATTILRETMDPTGLKVLDYLDTLRANASPETPIWAGGHGELESALNRFNQSVGFGQSDPEDAGEQLVSEAERIID